MNSINALFRTKPQNVLSIYFTAGYPEKESTAEMIREITMAGADMIEIGIPFSDPLADGPTIQYSNAVALKNGMSLTVLFEQLKDIRQHTSLPLILMSYLNPVLQFGAAAFCREAQKCGIDGLIIPDLPLPEYIREYEAMMTCFSLKMIFLITPQTEVSRIRLIDELSDSFLYLVTASGTTGSSGHFDAIQRQYFKKVRNLNLKNPLIAGFGIQDKANFQDVCRYLNGGIIGSSFIRAITNKAVSSTSSVHQFIKSIRS